MNQLNINNIEIVPPSPLFEFHDFISQGVGFEVYSDEIETYLDLNSIPQSRWELLGQEFLNLISQGDFVDLGFYFYYKISSNGDYSLEITKVIYSPVDGINETQIISSGITPVPVPVDPTYPMGNTLFQVLYDPVLPYIDDLNSLPSKCFVKAYFSYQDLQYLTNGSEKILFSLSIADFGDITFESPLTQPHYFTIKGEAKLDPSLSTGNMQIPSLIAGTPCPPLWREFASGSKIAIPESAIDNFVIDQIESNKYG